MTAQEFHTALSNPESLGAADVEALQELTRVYPWFGSAHILLAKAMHNAGNLGFDDQLHLAAVHAGSRSVLYDLIVAKEVAAGTVAMPDRNEAEVEPEPVEVIETVAEPEIRAPEPVREEVAEVIPPAEVKVEEEVEATEVKEVEKASETDVEEAEVEETELTKAAAPEEVEVPLPPETPEQAPETKRPLDELETQILAEGVSRVIEQEVDQVAFRLEPEPTQTAPELPQPEEVSPPPPTTTDMDSENLSPFAQWLLKRSGELGVEVAPVESMEGPAEPIAESTEDISEHTPEVPEVEPVDDVQRQQALIDAFIAKDPHITPKRVTDFDPGDIARDSIVEDESLVTETMARIYAKQGKTSKARKAYELLALKYPEKSVYFANQLKKLDKKK